MSYNIAICDDEAVAIQFISKLVLHWASTNKYKICMESFNSAEEFLFKSADKNFDILLLDVEMGKMNGVSLAREIRKKNHELQIVFVTGYMDYIQDGYDVEALNYLLKPITKEKLSAVLNRAVERLKSCEKALLLTISDETIRVPLYEIKYLEVRKNYVTLHAGEDYEVKKTLSELEKNLDESFFRTGRSFIVNLRFVRKITRTNVELLDGSIVPLSRGMYDNINRAMIEYF